MAGLFRREDDKKDELTRQRLLLEECLRRMTRIETRLCKLMLAAGLTEDGSVRNDLAGSPD